MSDPTLSIRRDLLDRPVRKYADNLTAQLQAIWRQHEVKTLDDFKRLTQDHKIPESVVRQYRDLIIRLSEVVRSGKFPPDYPVVEYGEHRIDLNEILQASRDFYASHKLQALADSLPLAPDSLTPEQRKKIEFALEQGFTSALILPPTDLLQQNLTDILEQTANIHSDKLQGDEQYEEASYLDLDIKQALTHKRPPSSSYLLLYSPEPIPEQTKNQTPENLVTLFENNYWNSLTVPEYLLLQRIEAEIRGNHSFDAHSEIPRDFGWIVLLDSRESSFVAYASWDPQDRMVRVYWGSFRDEHPKIGAHPSVVVEL